MSPPSDFLRVAAVGGLHGTKQASGRVRPLFFQISEQADVLLLCGHLTDNGLPEEAETLIKELAPALKVPVLAVFGNHDFESGKQDELRKLLLAGGVQMLDGESRVVNDIGFVGVKGFGGG